VVRSPPRPAPAVRTPAPAPPEPALKRATTAEPEAPRGYRAQLAEARRLFQEGRTRDARRLFEQLREERDDDPEVHVGLGACALRSERFLAAIEHYRAALERRPDHPAAVMGLAETYRRRGQVEEALTWYRTYLKNPDNPKARQARTQIARLEELQGLSTGP
jgi:Flp pilus assembly protein TadD